MNRVNAVGGEYARIGRGSLRNIVFQPGQFVCASETEAGAYNPQNIYNMNPTSEHYAIADWALAGNRLPTWGRLFGFIILSAPPAAASFPRMSGTYRYASATTAFITPPTRTTKLNEWS